MSVDEHVTPVAASEQNLANSPSEAEGQLMSAQASNPPERREEDSAHATAGEPPAVPQASDTAAAAVEPAAMESAAVEPAAVEAVKPEEPATLEPSPVAEQAQDPPAEATPTEVATAEATTESPVADAPPIDSPVDPAPVSETAVAETPASEAPVTESPVSASTSTESVAMAAPVAEKSGTEESVAATKPSTESETPAAAEAASEPEASASQEAPRKVQLNPTIPGGAGRAVPTIPADPTAAGMQAPAQDVSAESVPSKGPVEIPQLENLDADLESQLNAALSASQVSAAAGSTTAAAAGTPQDESELEPGTKLKGKIESVDDENVIVDIGVRASGILSRRHYEGKPAPEVGSVVDVVVESVNAAEGIVQLGLLRSAHRAPSDWDTLVAGQIVECVVQKTNKGGLDVQVGQLRGFMPAGQVDLHFVGDLEPFVGQKLTARVIDINPKKRNLVVSRKSLLQEEREQSEADAWQTITVGEQRTGTVKTLKDYGAFIDIGGIDGLLHVRELSWTRVNHPADVLKEGEQIEVKILSIDSETKKISLGMKQLLTNPWDYAEQKYAKNTVVSGIVKKVTEFGAFVEIEPGLEGLIHISELDFRRVNRVQDVLTEGQETEAQVLEINKNKKRISLSLKALKPKPQPSAEEVAARQASVEEEQHRREADAKRRKTLKGGIGGNKGGGLFGNPDNF